MVDRFPIRCPVSRLSPSYFDFTHSKIAGYQIMFPCGLEERELTPEEFVFSLFRGSSSVVQTGLATFIHLLVSRLVCALIHFSELKTIHCDVDYPPGDKMRSTQPYLGSTHMIFNIEPPFKNKNPFNTPAEDHSSYMQHKKSKVYSRDNNASSPSKFYAIFLKEAMTSKVLSLKQILAVCRKFVI